MPKFKRTQLQRDRALINLKIQVGQQWSIIQDLTVEAKIRRVQTALLQTNSPDYRGEYAIDKAHKDAKRIVADIQRAFEGGLDPFQQLDSKESMTHNVKYVEEDN